MRPSRELGRRPGACPSLLSAATHALAFLSPNRPSGGSGDKGAARKVRTIQRRNREQSKFLIANCAVLALIRRRACTNVISAGDPHLSREFKMLVFGNGGGLPLVLSPTSFCNFRQGQDLHLADACAELVDSGRVAIRGADEMSDFLDGDHDENILSTFQPQFA